MLLAETPLTPRMREVNRHAPLERLGVQGNCRCAESGGLGLSRGGDRPGHGSSNCLYPDVVSAVRAMTRVARMVEPDPAHVGLYDALYSRVYKQMYERLAPLYAQIQAITGYPQLD